MSSSGERGPSESLLVRAKEATKNPHLVWLVERAPSPRQTVIICQKLRLNNEEEKNTKALAWFKKHQPEQFRKILNVSQAKNKTLEKKERRKKKGGKRNEINEINNEINEINDINEINEISTYKIEG